MDDKDIIKTYVVEFFKDLYSNPDIYRLSLEWLKFKLLGEDQRDWLERPIIEEEFKKVVWKFENDKSAELDGFSMAFYKECWDILKGDILKTVDDFYTSEFLDVGSNATFISLIPKKEGAVPITDFRLISLISSS